MASAANNTAASLSAAELTEEIQFQHILLASIDDTVRDRESAEQEVRTEIKNLEKALRIAKERERAAAAAGASGARPNLGGSYRSIDPFDDAEDPFSDLVSGDTGGGSFAKHIVSSSNASTPDSVASAAAGVKNLLSPSQHKLPSRKRSYADQSDLLESYSANKSRRTTPSPVVGRSVTPSTSDEEHNLETIQRNQLDAESLARSKIEQERADEQLARQLQNEMSGGNESSFYTFPRPSQASSSSQPTSKNNAFSKLQGSHHSSFSSSQAQNSKPGFTHQGAFKSEPRTKPEYPDGEAQKQSMPGSFPNNEDSESELEIIAPHNFSPSSKTLSATNSRSTIPVSGGQGFGKYSGSALSNRSGFSTAAESAREAALRRTQSPWNSGEQSLFSGVGEGMFQASNSQLGQKPGAFANNSNYNNVYGQDSFNMSHGFSRSSHNGTQRPGYIQNGMSHANQLGCRDSLGNYPSRYGNASGQQGSSSQAMGLQLSRQDLSSAFNDPIDSYGVSSRMVDSYGVHLNLDERDVMNDPRKTAEELKQLLENISNGVEIPKENREGTPDALKYPLYEHQKVALTWLKQMEDGSNKGGILADDMGLGKTISALALILTRPSDDIRRKTTLIIGPVALIRQWEREIATKTKRDFRITTFIYHGNKKASWDNLKVYDVVLTTYGTLGAEYKRWEQRMAKSASERDEERGKFPFLGDKSLWYRVILDEAQCIKNKNTKAAQGAAWLKSTTRFCLTGTPMMNGVHELYSLIHFLRIKPYNDSTRFNTDFNCLTKGNSSPYVKDAAMRRLQAVLKAIMLRRTKTSTIDGQPILTLPPKTEEIVHVLFNEDEQAYYTSLESKSKMQFNKYMKAGTVGKNYSNILVLLLRLRQAACHPHLIMDFEPAPGDMTVEEMIELAKGLDSDVIRRIVAAAGQFECPVCYDPTPNPRIVIPCGHDTCSECLVKISAQEQDQAIQQGIDGGRSGGKCPSCRGKIDMQKIIDYETFKKVHMPETVEEEDGDGSADEAGASDDDSVTDSDNDTVADDDEAGDLKDFVVPDNYQSGDEDDDDDDLDLPAVLTKKEVKSTVKDEVKDDDDMGKVPKKKATKPRAKRAKKTAVKDGFDDDDDEDFNEAPKKLSMKAKGKRKADPQDDDELEFPEIGFDDTERNIDSYLQKKNKRKRAKKPKKKKAKKTTEHLSLAMLKKEANKNAANRRIYMDYLRENWVSSAKTDKCVEILRNTAPGIKTIIFSQFTTLLDLLEVPVRLEMGNCYRRYDGGMSSEKRNQAVVDFTDKPDCKIMLVSLKAGNAGLNLVAASQVIILDPFWNPYVEMQAVDRAHRIGQQKPVTVHRILVKATVEDRIMALQEKKRALVDAALDEKASQGLGRLGQAELAYLFNASGVERETASRPTLPPPPIARLANPVTSLTNSISSLTNPLAGLSNLFEGRRSYVPSGDPYETYETDSSEDYHSL